MAKKADEPKVKLYPTNCWQCNRDMTLPFEPDGMRPTYCTECFQKIRSGKVVASTTPPASLAGANVMVEEKPKPPAGISLTQAMGKDPFAPHEVEIEEDDDSQDEVEEIKQKNTDMSVGAGDQRPKTKDQEIGNPSTHNAVNDYSDTKPVFPAKPLPVKDIDFHDEGSNKTMKPGEMVKF
jgi:CxxC-x17-CxxC domain-containing protein